MEQYEQIIARELAAWKVRMLKKPGLMAKLSKRTQDKLNAAIPEKVHNTITAIIKQMIRGVLFGAKYTTSRPPENATLRERELIIQEKIKFYRSTAAIEGGVTGAGGIFLGLADFPMLLALKLKLLYEIATVYGFDLNDYKERIYLLHVFELAFSGKAHSREVFLKIENWEQYAKELPEDIHQFDWRKFQQEYRDYLDIAKMAQLLPIIGAPVGFVVNYKLVKKLGETAINAYRMRYLKSGSG
ncbi:EcsC family protein [Niabella digestorum]|uniref:EcsC family protein n=1 Tax=Niabella digestorum TaxID=3117701 RepID=A0ABU7RDA7_9BACT